MTLIFLKTKPWLLLLSRPASWLLCQQLQFKCAKQFCRLAPSTYKCLFIYNYDYYRHLWDSTIVYTIRTRIFLCKVLGAGPSIYVILSLRVCYLILKVPWCALDRGQINETFTNIITLVGFDLVLVSCSLLQLTQNNRSLQQEWNLIKDQVEIIPSKCNLHKLELSHTRSIGLHAISKKCTQVLLKLNKVRNRFVFISII